MLIKSKNIKYNLIINVQRCNYYNISQTYVWDKQYKNVERFEQQKPKYQNWKEAPVGTPCRSRSINNCVGAPGCGFPTPFCGPAPFGGNRCACHD